MRVVTDAFGLAHVAARHHIQAVGFFAKPYWGGDGGAVLTEGRERDIFLADDGGWDGGGHQSIVNLHTLRRWLRG